MYLKQRIGLRQGGAPAGHFPIFSGSEAGKQKCNAPAFVMSEDRSIDIGLKANIFDDTHDIVMALPGHIAPVMDDSVDRAPGDAGHSGHVLDRNFAFVFFHTQI